MKSKTKNAQHTPGPWVMRKTVTGPFKDSRPWYSVGPKIDGAVHFVASEMYEEDARLIAAAPDLLEAAKELDRLYAMGIYSDTAQARVRAIIAKAEGR